MPTPQASQHVTTIRSDEAPSEIIVRFEQQSDLWHKALNDLHDSGILRSLPDSAYRVFHTFQRLRHRDTGRVEITLEDLITRVGRRRSYVSDGRKLLLEHPASLLARVTGDLYEVLPGWSFAQRVLEPHGHNPARPEPPPPRMRQAPSATADRASATADGNPQSRTMPRALPARALNLSEEEREDKKLIVVESRESPSPDERAAQTLLVGAGFNNDDALRQVRRHQATSATVKIAVANAIRKRDIEQRKGRPFAFRGYILAQLRDGCSLFESIEHENAQALRVTELLVQICGQYAGPHDVARCEELHAWWSRLSNAERARQFDARAIERGGAEWLARRIGFI